MTHTISSEVEFTAADYVEYLRCPRTAHLRLTGELASGVPPVPLQSDRSLVQQHALRHLRFPNGAETSLRLERPPFTAVADVFHAQRPDGYASVVIREASSLKKAYVFECLFIRWCAQGASKGLVRQFVYYLDKEFRAGGDPTRMYVAADVTRRAGILLVEHERRIRELEHHLASDPLLERYRNVACDRPHRCEACSRLVGAPDREHVRSLYRGADLASDLIDEGYERIVDVPRSRLPHPRQRIQQDALRAGEAQLNRDELRAFLEDLVYPVHYLDFEAFSGPIPELSGTRPWEHVPFLYSVHTRDAADGALEHHAFIADPAMDQRDALLDGLVTCLAGDGSILVYGAAFETGVLRRLAAAFPEYESQTQQVLARIVDLLRPFKEFHFYDPDQRGKVGLKRVLPAFSTDLYDGLLIRDGLTANVVYRYLRQGRESDPFSTGLAALPPSELMQALVDYCTVDTLAMVRIVARMSELVNASGP